MDIFETQKGTGAFPAQPERRTLQIRMSSIREK